MKNPAAFDLVNRIAPMLPIPLVGSVLYDGHKERRECTVKAFEAFEECMELAAPTRILEIGTHAGGSALLMLALSRASIVSVDIGHTWITPDRSFVDWGTPSETDGGLIQVQAVLNSMFPDRFAIYVGDSTSPTTIQQMALCNEINRFDCAFIDGDHDPAYITKDIETCLSLGIKTLIMDDWNCETPGVAATAGLTVVKEWPLIHSSGVSFALCRAS